MGLLDSIKTIVAGAPPVRLDEPAAQGEAAAAVAALIADVKSRIAPKLRDKSRDGYLEAVLTTDQLEACTALLAEALGEPAKPFGQRPAFDGSLEAMIDSHGGIDTNQCLFLRRYSDGRVAFAALWPWSNRVEITLKLGVYAG